MTNYVDIAVVDIGGISDIFNYKKVIGKNGKRIIAETSSKLSIENGMVIIDECEATARVTCKKLIKPAVVVFNKEKKTIGFVFEINKFERAIRFSDYIYRGDALQINRLIAHAQDSL